MERVYVGNLPPDIRIKDIDDFFRAFGKLVYIDVNHRANPVYALVQFDSARNAFNAVKARHGYDYEGYTLQLRLVENEVRKRRETTPPPPPPPMFSEFSSQSNRGGSNNGNSNNNNNRMTGNFANSNSYQSSTSNSQWSNMSQGMQQQNNRVNMPQQNMMDYQTNNRSNNMQQQNMMQYSFGGSGGGGGNGGGRSNMSGNTNTNRSNMQQQFSNANRSNMQQQQQFSNANRSNMQQQQPQYSHSSQRSNMLNSKSTNRSNMQHQQQQQYSNSNRSNMQQQQSQNMNNYSNMPQQNMMNNYSNSNYSNMSQQQQQNNMNMMNYSNNATSWNSGSGNNNNNMMNNNMAWNAAGNNMNNMNNYNNNNINNNNNNPPNNYIYNSNNDPYARAGFEDNFTHGLSGSGRKWFNRYIRKGFSPEMARNKALEHRTQPYQRENVNINNNNNIDNNAVNPIPNDPTNVALETIGNTILSLLSTNPVDNFNNDNQMIQSLANWSGGDNFQAGYNSNDMPGPSTSMGNMMSQSPVRGQQPRNRVSRQQYLKSLDILRKLRGKRDQTAKDRLSKKYHTQIVRDYEQYEKSMSASSVNKPRAITTSSNPRNDRQIAAIAAEGKSYTQLSIALRKKKQQLFIAAKRLSGDPNKRYGGAYKKRIRILTNECGFEDLEAKALAVHPLDKLKPLMDLKAECDNALKNKPDSFSAVKKIVGNRSSKIEAYRNDITFLKKHEKLKINDLSPRLKSTIRSCLIRIHKHEKELRKPLTKTKFIRLLSNKTGQKATTSTTKKTAGTSKTNAAATTTKKEVEKKEENTTGKAQENKQQVTAESGSNKPKQAEKNEGK